MQSLNIEPGLTGCYELTTGTGRRLVLVGLGDRVEIWPLEAWRAEQERLLYDDDFDRICPELTAEQWADLMPINTLKDGEPCPVCHDPFFQGHFCNLEKVPPGEIPF